MLRTEHALWVLLLCLCLLGCDDRGAQESSGTDCADGVDDDGDGLIDCADPGCSVHPWCGGGVDGGRADAGRADAGADAGRVDAGPIVPGCNDPIDVVFVIDVSTSMRDEVASIRSGIDAIWTATESLTSAAEFSLVVFVDDAVSVNACAPFASREAMQTELAEWQSFTSSNQQPSGSGPSNSDCAENSLDAIHLAATTCPFRDDALHLLIHVTDDTFAERPAVLSESVFGGGGVPVQNSYAEVAEALVLRQVRVGAFAAPGAGEECGAGSSANVGRGFHEPYLGMPSLPDATGGRAWSIRDVRAGTLNMADAINAFTADEYCTLF